MAILVEAGWGGLITAPATITWTDISQYVDMVQGIAISRGASDELSETQPGTMTLRLDNADGRFTPGNSASPYYPFVRRNAPVRAAVTTTTARTGVAPWPAAMLSDDFDDERIDTILWPSSYGGAVEVGGKARVPLIPGGFAAYQSARSWTLAGSAFWAKLATLPSTLGSSAASAGLMANSLTAGTRVGFQYSPVTGELRCVSDVGYFDAGATVLTYSPISHAWLRMRETGGTLYWETSSTGTGWTVRRSIATPAWVTSQALVIEMPTSRTGGSTDYVEWDLFGHRVRSRFWGTLNELPVDWEGLESKVTVSASDLFKRLNRLPSLKSCLVEEVLLYDPRAYYPLTEPAGATSAGDLSGRASGALARLQVSSGGTADFGADGPPATGETCLSLVPASASAGKYFSANLGSTFQSDSGLYWKLVECFFKTSTNSRALLGLYSPDLDHELVLALNGSGVLVVEHIEDGPGTRLVQTTTSGNLANDVWHHVVYDEANRAVYVDGFLVGTYPAISGMGNLRGLHVGGYRGARLWSGQIGHVAVYLNPVALGALRAEHYTAGMTAYDGEAADERVSRLARYAGITDVTVWGSTHDPVAAQGEAGTAVMPRLREVEATESGKLFAERDWYGLAYQSRDLRYNPDPLSEVFTIAYADLEPGTSLRDDDQKLTNQVEASRPGGATQRVSAPESVAAYGTYSQQLTLLKTSDNSVLDAAYWTVSRYADPGPELREVPVEAFTMTGYSDILDADISTYFSVTGLPSQAPASSMRVTIEGYTETIREKSHTIQFHTSTSATDSVWVLDDPTYSVLGTTTRLAY
ncbi:LamG domain-containing protein [Streptomyces sp. NBC_00237]|uniref:LamG-like jellyroll fold domain-containing protein n=1 Tax=Streptomyces sp. NBC_00237 TaxID=2975687 RepID=UPI00224D67E3|nr:LamG-like jellyroll fold domain-containing protein [Streptomyces sp. NBC_00237]MCX5201040.1 LamG domain-containing protein [Streptomyces sp. NBC_00237]